MMKWILLAGLVGFGGYLGVAVYQDREVQSQIRQVAEESLANLHPRYLAKVRARLAKAARALGAELNPGDVHFSRRPTDRGWARAALATKLGTQAVPQLVSLELAFSTRLMGFEQRHHLKVEKVILVEPTREVPTQLRGAGLPIPIFLD